MNRSHRQPAKPDRSRIGATGGYFAAAQLAFRGWDASMTIGNAPRTDIVAQHGETQRLIAVQCKTATGTSSRMGANCELTSPLGRDEWFIIVALGDPLDRPTFYVVPRNVIAAYVYVGHRAWLTGTSRSGGPHQDNSTRTVEHSAIELYRERWDLLERAADEAPQLLPQWVFDWAPKFGLPTGHPGLVHPGSAVALPDPASWARRLDIPR